MSDTSISNYLFITSTGLVIDKLKPLLSTLAFKDD